MRRLHRFVIAFIVLASWSVVAQSPGVTVGGPLPGPLPLFPPDNWWNLDIGSAPVDTRSTAIIDWIQNGEQRRLHPDFGGDTGFTPPDPLTYGMIYVVVPGTQALEPVDFFYATESDPGAPGRPPGYPIPLEAKTQPRWIEGGLPGGGTNGDRHMLIVDRDNRFLYELFGTFWNTTRGRWEAGSGAVFSLDSNARRPEGWTSADGAGLAILPGLIRHDEVFGPDPIRHAFRVTTRATNGYVFPASHRAGSNPSAPPMGARFRLKASKDLSSYAPHIRKIFQAMKIYGLIVADNGSDMFVQGTYDSRWNMCQMRTAFRSLYADDFEIVQLGWNPPSPPPTDTDGDGLPDSWEIQFGLDPSSTTGANGATGDPDDDGLSNLQEFQSSTYPTLSNTWQLPEGATGFFQNRLAVVNPGPLTSEFTVTFFPQGGSSVTRTYTLPSQRRMTIDVNAIPGLASVATSATLTTTRGGIAVERTLRWDARDGSWYGGHTGKAIHRTRTSWYLAEGEANAFDTWILFINPNSTAATVQVRFLLEQGAPITQNYVMGAQSRMTVFANEVPGLRGRSFSVAVTSSVPIAVERAMYFAFGDRFWSGGHASAAIPSPALNWFVAEGRTGAMFETYLLLGNPGGTQALATVRYLKPDGSVIQQTYTLAATSRMTIRVNSIVGLEDTDVSATVVSTQPIVVERAMYWPGRFPAWHGAHSSSGLTETGTSWVLAEGETGGASDFDSYVLIVNPGNLPASVTLTFLRTNGAPVSLVRTVPAQSRLTVSAREAPLASGEQFGISVVATQPIAVERAMYWNAVGLFWAAGTNETGIKLR